ncbi:MAG TPA: transaldolase [Candidatus Dormibacteraeota bacterium]|jgi:transaldolase
MPELKDLRIKIFADGADREGMVRLAADPHIKGFTTNPTLMNAAGIRDMEGFAREILEAIPDKPISFEVFADEFDEMERQALKITTWGPNVYVKIPVTNTRGVSASSLTSRLCEQGVKLNLTALMTPVQVAEVAEALAGGPPAIVSVFAGRIADSGVDPIPLMRESLEILKPHAGIELLWASPREVLNIVQADQLGCHIITVTHDLLKKLSNLGKDLTEFSLDTVKMFFNDGQAAGFAI